MVPLECVALQFEGRSAPRGDDESVAVQVSGDWAVALAPRARRGSPCTAPGAFFFEPLEALRRWSADGMVRRTASVLRLFFPLLLGFSGGTVLWGLGRFAAPDLPHARGPQYGSGLERAKPDSYPTGAQTPCSSRITLLRGCL
jgi:hypothetical protein